MKNDTQVFAEVALGSEGLRSSLPRMLTGALPFLVLAVPGTVYAQAVNTATVTAPAGAIETDTSNNSATDSDTVLAALVATNDNAVVASSPTVQNTVLNVLTADMVNGSPATATSVDISVAPTSSLPSQLTFDTSTGAVGVVAGTPAGVYSFVYQICEAGTSNCTTATATVTVNPTLIANDDSTTVQRSTTAQPAVLNVFTADTVDGNTANPANSDLSVASGSTVPSQLTFNPATGEIGVVAGAPSGTYFFDYQICEEGGTSFCQTATATVIVVDITADADSVTGVNGTVTNASVINVLPGDTLNGSPITNPADVVISVAPGSTLPPQLTFNTTNGDVGVLAGTPAGVYTFDYRICDVTNPTICATETVSVTVAASINLSITKSNGVTDVTSGTTTTYNLVVSNSGPDAATGAVVTDTPGAGLTCPGGNAVTFSGDGIPSGSFTIADLTGAGITLGTLGNGQSVTLTYTCNVN